MKLKNLFSVILISIFSISAFAEVPSIMILPSQQWQVANGYGKFEESNGRKKFVDDYDNAVLNQDFHAAEAAVAAVLQDHGVKPISYGGQSEMDDLEEADDEVSDMDDEGVEKNNRDDLYSKLKGDIQFLINWQQNAVGFNKSISFDIIARDAYSGMDIATVTAESPVVSKATPLTALVKQTVQGKMPELMAKVQAHFDDLVANGRIITVRFSIKKGSAVDFETDVNGNTLGSVIYDWMANNTVNGKFVERSATKNTLRYNQVRIPVKDERGNDLNSRRYLDRVVKYIKSLGYNAINRSPLPGVGNVQIFD